MRRLRLGIAALLIGLVGPAAAFSAATDDFDSAATTCDQQVYEQPFLRWADPAQYVLAPGGTFHLPDCNNESLVMEWRAGSDYARLDLHLPTLKAEIVYSSADGQKRFSVTELDAAETTK